MGDLYNIAKNEFEEADENGKHRLVYAYFGSAIYFGQCLEETFSIMLWTDRIFKNKVKTYTEINKIIDAIENSKKTMGRFINEIKQTYDLTPSIVDQLDKILETRNYLAHKYFKLNIAKFYSEIGQLEMLQLFGNFIDDCKQLDSQLLVYYKKYTDRLGLSEERIEQLVKEMKDEEMKRVAKQDGTS